MSGHKYKAFISYSHKDDRWAKWLHKRLENYHLPKSIIGKETQKGRVPRRLKPVFRDREELAAADDLGENIEKALVQSENLIVICSPQAAKSHWVNEEILFFKRQNRNAQIFSIIVDGEPYASNNPETQALEAFPPALRFQLGEDGVLSNIPAEPLAADLRDHADGKRLGLLKLISGLIGVGLDEIVQRDMQRNRRRVMAITSTALATILVMGTLTGFALNARQEAEQQRGIAQARTTSAEELIEFMVTDLKVKLKAVGRLDALQVVGEEASSYYDQYPLTSHDDDALGRRARVFHFLGEIQTDTGDLDTAESYFLRAYESSQTLLAREPENPDRIFDHAQSAFWAAHVPDQKDEYEIIEKYYNEYLELAERLEVVEPDSLRSLQEKTYAYANLANINLKQKRPQKAYELYQTVLPVFQRIAEDYPGANNAQLDIAVLYSWLANCSIDLSRFDDAIAYREKQYNLLEKLEGTTSVNADIRYDKLTSALALIWLYGNNNDLSKAQSLATESLNESKSLWSSDKENSKWLYNYSGLLLRQVNLAFQRDDLKMAQETLRAYHALHIDSKAYNEHADAIFDSHQSRYDEMTQTHSAKFISIGEIKYKK